MVADMPRLKLGRSVALGAAVLLGVFCVLSLNMYQKAAEKASTVEEMGLKDAHVRIHDTLYAQDDVQVVIGPPKVGLNIRIFFQN